MRLVQCTFLFVLAVSCFGCSKFVVVSGIVTIDGVPASSIAILFEPKSGEGKEPAFGITTQDGRYTLKSGFSKRHGIEPGEYRVFLNWKDPTAPLFPEEGYVPNKSPFEKKFVERAKLPDPSFPFTVPKDGTNQANFDL